MKARVELTQGAEEDLLGIYRRRRAQRGAEGADGADALLDTLIDKLESLAEFAQRGTIPPELEALGIGTYRQLSLAPYRVIYRPDLERSDPVVTVMLIADARRDFRVLLDERLLRASSGKPPPV